MFSVNTNINKNYLPKSSNKLQIVNAIFSLNNNNNNNIMYVDTSKYLDMYIELNYW